MRKISVINGQEQKWLITVQIRNLDALEAVAV